MKDDLDEKLAQLCVFGNQKLIIQCIEQGANVNSYNGYAGKLAIQNDKFNILKLLLKYGFNELDEAFIEAIEYKKHDMAKLLIEKGANIHVYHEKALFLAINQKDFVAFELLMENKANCHVDNDVFLMKLLISSEFKNLESVDRKIFNCLLNKINVHTFNAEDVFMKHVDAGTFYYTNYYGNEDAVFDNLEVVIDYVNAKKESIHIEKTLVEIEEKRHFELTELGMIEEIKQLEVKPKRKQKI